jgi:beta-ribofuranosylaminobenzene 5'-phosphate synthase
MSRSVHVHAPCRLHFGMFGFGQPGGRQFGGVGAMIDPPAVEVEITPAEKFAVQGSLADRVERFVVSALRYWHVDGRPHCRITVDSPADHTGLGVGTQLGLAVAAALRPFLEMPDVSIEDLALSVGRGARSAIGTYGFQQGGLIVDSGKSPHEALGKLARRVALPEEWHFVLVQDAGTQGLAGDRETEAFATLPAVLPNVTRELWRITNDEMLPAIARRDCQSFGDAVYRFGRLAGECFADVQGGPFASPQTAALIETIREYGVLGVGQSSWGPTVFAIVENELDAKSLADWLAAGPQAGKLATMIAKPNNVGAQLSTS